MQTQFDQWNARYSVFYVTRYSRGAGRSIQVGRAYRTVESALAAAERADQRRPQDMHFIDVVKPGHAADARRVTSHA